MTERRQAIQDARQERREEWQTRPPSELEANLALTACQSRIDHCSLCDAYGAVFQRSGEEQRDTWQEWFKATFPDAPGLPHVVENLAPENIWQHWNPPPPPGIPCTYGLVWSGTLFEWQVDAINACQDLTAVIMAGEQQKQAMREAAQRLRDRLTES